MSDNNYVDWSMIHLIRIPKAHSLYVYEDDIHDNKLVEFTFGLDYNQHRKSVTLTCDAQSRSDSYVRNSGEVDINRNKMQQMLEDSIENESPIYENEELIEDIKRLKRRTIVNRNGFLNRSYDNYKIYNLDVPHSFIKGEGFIVNSVNKKSVGIFSDINFTVELSENSRDSENAWIVKGEILNCELVEDEHDVIAGMFEIDYIHYSDKQKVNIQAVTIKTIDDFEISDNDENVKRFTLEFQTNFVPMISSITSTDLRNMQIKKMKVSNKSDTVTGDRLLSIRINEEVNKMTNKGGDFVRVKSNNNVKKRFSKILGNS